MKKVAFLIDENNSWIKNYIADFCQERYLSDKYKYELHYDETLVVNYDIVFILGYTKILDPQFLQSNKLNLVIHESDLPRGKGFSPVQWQIIEGKNNIISTLLIASDEVDGGDIILQTEIGLSGYELLDEIRKKQGEATVALIKNFLKIFPNFDRRVQFGESTFYNKRRIDDDKLDIDKTIREQFNHMRVANNDEFPLWFEIDGHIYKILIYKY